MKNTVKTFIIFSALLILQIGIFAQSKTITGENYRAILQKTGAKTDTQIRKEVLVQKIYSGGEITETITYTTEYIPPDKLRRTFVHEKGIGTKKSEQIIIGNLIYRKNEDGSWSKNEKEEDGGFGGGIGSDNSTREFFTEESRIGREKYQVLIEKKVNYTNTFLDENKTWINKKGLIFKKLSTTTNIGLKKIASSIETTYEYLSRPPKIEAPVKLE